MKKIIFLWALCLFYGTTLFAQTHPITVSLPYVFQKYVHVKGSLFADSTIVASDSTNKAPNTAWVKRAIASGNAYTASLGVKLTVHNFTLDTVYAGTKFLNINQVASQTVHSPVTFTSGITVSGASSFSSQTEFFVTQQIKDGYAVRFENAGNSLYDWFIQNGRQAFPTAGGSSLNIESGSQVIQYKIFTDSIIRVSDGKKVLFQGDVTSGTTTNPLTINNSGTGAASGSTFNGSSGITISYNSIGAQPTLVSGTNLKTINSTSLLGSTDILLQTPITLTTTGTSGAATFSGGTLNIPQYAGTTYTFSTGLTNTSGTITVNSSQSIATLSNLTSNGLIKTSGGTGALSIATAGTDYLTPTGSAAGLTSFPTLNQNTTGSAATLTTARTIAGTSFNGSANIALANKFIVQGTTDAGLSGAQFLGALGTGIVKNTTTTGVLSIAAAGTDYQAPISLTTTGTSGAATFIGNTLNIPQYAGTTYAAGTGLTLTTGTFSVNSSQSISTLSNLTTNGLIKTSGGTGALSIATAGTDYGTVNSIAVTTANGVSGSSSGGSNPALTLTLGAITPTSVNKVTITTPATGSTLTIADGATLQQTGAFVLNLTATAASTPTFPTGSGTLPYIGSANTWSALQTFGTNISIGGVTAAGATGTGSVVFSASPALTGSPTAPTQTTADATTKIATDAFVQNNMAANATYFSANVFSGAGTSGSPYNITVTTTGTSGAATLVSGVLNIPQYSGGGTGANPTGTIGLTAVNGSATTFLRSDGAPALSQAIVPTWTGVHTFSTTNTASSGTANYGTVISHTVNQTSTASFTDLFLNRINTAPGSGGQYLMDLEVGGVSQFNVTTGGTLGSKGAATFQALISSFQFNSTSASALQGFIATNSATASAAQPNLYAPGYRWHTSVWNTTPTAAANYSDFNIEARGVSGTTPSSLMVWQAYTGTNSTTPTYTDRMTLDNITGNLSLLTGSLIAQGATFSSTISANGGINIPVSNTLNITGSGGNVGSIAEGTLTSGRIYTLPDKSGTFAMLSDITGGTGANPTATIGLTAVNGAATTFLRSDGAPALSQAIAPTWTALHTYSWPNIGVTSTDAILLANTTAAGASTPQWSPAIHFQGNYYTGSASQSTDWKIENAAQASGSNQGLLTFRYSNNGAAYGTAAYFSPGGIVTGGLMTLNQGFFGSTSTDVLYIKNGAAASSGTPNQKSGAIQSFGSVWNTTSVAAANYFAFREEASGNSGLVPTAEKDWYGYVGTSTTPTFTKVASLDNLGNFTSTNTLNTKHIIGTSSAPTIAAGTGAGTSPTISISAGSTDMDGVINVTTGTSPAANGIVATITFNTAYSNVPTILVSPGASSFAALTQAQIPFSPARGQTNNPTTTTFVIQAGTSALPASTTFVWTYHVMQ